MLIPQAVIYNIKQTIYFLMQLNGIVSWKLRALKLAGDVPVLSLHRVGVSGQGGYAPLDAGIFQELLIWLEERFFIVSIGDLEAQSKQEKPKLILSFDDGYKDFIEITAPILDKRRIRVIQNIIPACVESGRPPMNVELQDFIASAPAALLRETMLPGLPSGADPDRRSDSCLRVSAAIKAMPIAEQKRTFSELEGAIAQFDGFRPTSMMTLDEIREIAVIHEIGAHSFEHASMATETDDYLREDLQKCMRYFELNLGFTPQIYAFANGSVRPLQYKIALQAGYRHVLLVGEDYTRANAWVHPRFTLHAQSLAEAQARALGWFRWKNYTKHF